MTKLIGKYELYAIVRQLPIEKNKDVYYIQCDLVEDWNTSQLPSSIDIIIHLAQSEYFREFPNKAQEVFSLNALSSLKLLDYARSAGVKSFIYASSGGIYGHGDQEFNEDVQINSRGDLGFYMGTKLCSEIIAENYSAHFNVIVLRFFFVYGQRQKRSMLLPRLVDSVLSGKTIILQSENGIRINPIHVDDAAASLFKTIDLKGSHKINIGGSENMTLREICDIIGKLINKTPNYTLEKQEPKNLVGDIKKMCKLLIAPKIKFEDGVKSLLK